MSNFSSYSATYGAFAAIVILLVWMWLTNVVLLFGAELNAAIDVRRSPDAAARLRGPAAAGQGAGRLVGVGRGRSVIASGQEQSAARPGQSPHSSRCGCGATGQRSSSTPAASSQQRVGERGRVVARERRAATGSAGRSSRQ